MNKAQRNNAASMLCVPSDLKYLKMADSYSVRTLDEGLSEAISSILWVAPRLQTDVVEMKVIADLLMAKYGRQYADVSVVTCTCTCTDVA